MDCDHSFSNICGYDSISEVQGHSITTYLPSIRMPEPDKPPQQVQLPASGLSPMNDGTV